MVVEYKSVPFRVLVTILSVLALAGHVFPEPQDDTIPPAPATNLQVLSDQIAHDLWIILPDGAHPYKHSDFEASLSGQFVSYPLTIRGRVIHDEKSGDWIEFELNGENVVLPRALVVRNTVSTDDNAYAIIGSEWLDRNRPLPLEYVPGDLIGLNQKWNFHGPDLSKFLRADAVRAIEAMLEDAQSQGIHLKLFSAYRSSEKQRYLYLKQIEKKGLVQDRVIKPGHSEHQLGTAVDLCGLETESVASYDFDRTKEGRWLETNAHRFGFVRSYTQETQEATGIRPEPWHFRFVGVVRSE